MNLLRGTKFAANLPIFKGDWKRPKFTGNALVKAIVIAENYGDKTGHHTFTFEVIESEHEHFKIGKRYLKKGRNLYPYLVGVQDPENYNALASEKEARKEQSKRNRNSFFKHLNKQP